MSAVGEVEIFSLTVSMLKEAHCGSERGWLDDLQLKAEYIGIELPKIGRPAFAQRDGNRVSHR